MDVSKPRAAGGAPLTAADLERLMADYGDGILRTCALFLRDPALAEDAAQESMLRAWRSYGGFRCGSSEKTWLTAIAMNVCRTMLRSPWRTRRAGPEALEGLTVTDAPRGDDTLLHAVAALPRKYREVVVLYYYQELTIREISQALSVPANTVGVRLKRARERLRPMLKEWYYDEP